MNLGCVTNQAPQLLVSPSLWGHFLGVFQVLVLSTRLLRPTDIAELLLATPRLSPDIGV